MLLWFVILYLLVSVGIGLLAATRVHNARDFAVAGRHLPGRQRVVQHRQLLTQRAAGGDDAHVA